MTVYRIHVCIIFFFNFKGIVFFVHEPGIIPDFSDGVLVAPGTEANLVISQINYNRLSHPYSNCTYTITKENELKSILAKWTFRHFKRYTQTDCILTCLNDNVVNSCNASTSEFRENTTQKIKINDQLCIDNVTRRYYENSTLVLGCLGQCPVECSLVEYSLASSYAAYPTVTYNRLMKDFFKIWDYLDPHRYNFSNISDFEKKILSVNIFYKVIFNLVFYYGLINFK